MEINNNTLNIAIAILVTLIITIVIIYYVIEYAKINNSKDSIETNGIVFDWEEDTNYSSSNSNSIKHPIIRFTTLKNEWITATPTISFSHSFLNIGDTVIVKYNKNNPYSFIIKL